ncbi:MAG TPA: sigma-70 family RNA polymerase sigma factor [Acidimicrobiales bacterium]|nr:sigma-70 family RNA polymerase sigma factor [Acidimicrobiales bacterium]
MADRAQALTASTTDADLAEAAASGDSTAFDELYRRHAETAWRVAYAVTGNREDASDAVAEAFTRIFTALAAGRLTDLGGFRPYLMATARNASIDVLRRSGRIHLVDDVASDETSATAGPSDRLMDRLDASLVASAFRSLPERWRSVLWLTEVEGMAPAEAAGLLGLSANGTAQLAVRARAGLRQRYLQAHLRSDVQNGCRFTVEHLGAYVGGGLAPRDLAKVDQHLAGCEECRQRLAELEDLSTSLRRIVVPLPLALGALAWRHWKLAAARPARTPVLPEGPRRALLGASVGVMGLGILGATLMGQAPFKAAALRPPGAAPVGSAPVPFQQVAATVPAPVLAPAPVADPSVGTVAAASAPAPTAAPATPPPAASPAPAPVINPPVAPAPDPTPAKGSASGGGGAGTGGNGSTAPIAQLSTQINLAPAPVQASASVGLDSSGPIGGVSVNGTSAGSPPPQPSPTDPPVSVSVSTPAGGTSATLP